VPLGEVVGGRDRSPGLGDVPAVGLRAAAASSRISCLKPIPAAVSAASLALNSFHGIVLMVASVLFDILNVKLPNAGRRAASIRSSHDMP
jgi:hypothetical protein